MSYIISPENSKFIKVPEKVITQLGRLSSDKTDYFKVALYILATNDFSPENIAKEIHTTRLKAEKALEFWHGTGLLSGSPDDMPVINERLPRMTTREVFLASQSNTEVQTLLQEAQSAFGEVIGQGEMNILASMLINDKMPLHFILLGLTHLIGQGYKPNKMKNIERKFLKWWELGIKDDTSLEGYFALEKKRDDYQKQVGEILHVSLDSFTYTEKCKISQWFENYSFTEPIISHAAVVAGDKSNVAYLSGILKKWYAKGYRTVRDVLSAENGTNAVTTVKQVAPENDFLSKRKGVVPKYRQL